MIALGQPIPGACSDVKLAIVNPAGVTNQAGDQASAAQIAVVLDSVPPAAVNAVLSPDGLILTINFDDDLDVSTLPDAVDFQLKDQFGNVVPFPDVSIVSAGNSYFGSLQLNLLSAILLTEPNTLSIHYEDDTPGDDVAGVIQDSFGNDAQTFTLPILPSQFPSALISLGEDADLVYEAGEGSGWVNVSANPTFQTYFQKLFPGSIINNQNNTLESTDFIIDIGSAEFFGFVGTGLNNISLQGFDSLDLKGVTEEISLPKGGLFLTSGGGYYPSSNTLSDYSVGREQAGNPIMSDFAQQAFSGAGSTNDASILRFRLTPQPGIESILLDLSFASDEYPEFADSSFIDIGAVWFDDQETVQNFAYFSGENGEKKPLSIVGFTVGDARFIDNTYGKAGLPIEFDGITKPLTIAIPLKALLRNEDGSLTINLGVADSEDSDLDSAAWFSNFVGSDFGFEGTLLKKSVGVGETFVAPTDTAVFVLAAPDSNLTPSTQPDLFELAPDPSATNQINIPDAIYINGDKYINVNNNTEFVFAKRIDFSITKGSAIIAIDNGDGTTSTFTLVGDFFDITQFSVVTSDDGRTTLRYTGPLVAGGSGGGGGGGDDVNPVASPSAGLPSIPPDSPLKNPAAIFAGDAGNNTFAGGDGSELFLGADGNDNLSGGAGDDDIRGNAGDDVISGGDGADYIRGGQGNDFINGNKGNDRIFGDKGDDIIYGGRGSDTINGNAGNDQLWGGLGADHFVASKGNDKIFDFSLSDGDKVNIVMDQPFTLLQVGIDLVIRREQGDLTLVGINLSAFQQAGSIVLI